MIRCTKCLKEKSAEAFNKNSRKANGKNSYCKSCQSEANKNWIQANKLDRKAYEKAYKEATKDARKQVKKEWDLKNSEWRKAYRKLNSYKYTAHAIKRYVKERLSQPIWLNKHQLQEIENFYWLAKDLKAVSGQTYHVDHIVPLQGKTVCGLHVPWNLQMLPADVNISKGNKAVFNEEGL